jgi:hypothetical protein
MNFVKKTSDKNTDAECIKSALSFAPQICRFSILRIKNRVE